MVRWVEAALVELKLFRDLNHFYFYQNTEKWVEAGKYVLKYTTGEHLVSA